MGPFRVPKWDHFGSPNGTISGPRMSPFRDSPNDPKMTTLGNGQIPTTTCGIAREKGGLRTSWTIAQSPSHSLSHPSDGFATTPARTAAVRASVKRFWRDNDLTKSQPEKKCNGSSARLGVREVELEFVGVRGRARVRVRVAEVEFPSPSSGSNSSLNPNCRVPVRDRSRIKFSFACVPSSLGSSCSNLGKSS